MGDGTEQNPYTREDVLRLIKENGDKAEGLDLSKKVFEKEIDLRKLNLAGIILKGAFLVEAHLEGAFLLGAHLERAFLSRSHLEEADLRSARLEGATLASAQFSPETNLEQADWGSYILGEKKENLFGTTADTYRRLKIWHTNAGMYDIAGKFFYREMTARRKALEWWPKPWNRAFSKLVSMLCGYGEKPERVVVSALVIIFGLAIAYRFGGLSLPYSIYYSFVSFTALGYGSWVPQPTDWVKGLGVAEAVIGVFMMALFLVTFTRKMTR